MISRLYMEGTAVGQANLGSYIGRNYHFKYYSISVIMPLAFNGSHRGNPFCFRMSKFSGGFGGNGQLAAGEPDAADIPH